MVYKHTSTVQAISNLTMVYKHTSIVQYNQQPDNGV